MPPPQTTLHKKYLFLVCFIAAMGGFLFGFDTAVISGALSFVVADFHFDAPMEGWFVSSALLGCIIGVAVSGKLSDVYGRKKIMLLSAGLFFLSAIGCMLAGNAATLICFRLIGGLGIGVASMICPLYISEFSPPSFRGRMVALYQLAITIGIVTAYFSNAWLLKLSAHKDLEGWLHYLIVQDTWRSMIGVGIIPSLLFLICLFLVPESPRWLLLKGKEELAFFIPLKAQRSGHRPRRDRTNQKFYERRTGHFKTTLLPDLPYPPHHRPGVAFSVAGFGDQCRHLPAGHRHPLPVGECSRPPGTVLYPAFYCMLRFLLRPRLLDRRQ